MNEQLHTDCSILRNKLPAVLPINISLNFSTKVRGPDFFKQIVQRYAIITKSDRFPSLILVRLLKNADGTTKLTNINKNNITKILNTSIKQYLNWYVTTQSEQNVIVSALYFNNARSSGKHVPEQQVNIRTDFAKDTKHIVFPRLMRYLQLIDNQNPGYEFQPISAKTLATAELVRTLPERIVYQREKSKNTVILSNNHYPERDIRVLRHTMQPVMARTSQEKTHYQNSIRSKKASLSKKYLDNDESTNPVVADISGVGVNENTKGRDIILHPLTHTEEKIPKMDAMMAHIQNRNKLIYEKHEDFIKRTADRYLVTEKNNIANKLISNTHIGRSRIANVEAEDGEVTEIPKLLFDQDGIFLQHAGNVQIGMSGPSNFPSNNIIRRPSDLVVRNLAVHSAEKGFENTSNTDIIKTEKTKINAKKEDIIGTNVQVRDSIEDIDIIADRVYKRIETKISIEKERRGLR